MPGPFLGLRMGYWCSRGMEAGLGPWRAEGLVAVPREKRLAEAGRGWTVQ